MIDDQQNLLLFLSAMIQMINAYENSLQIAYQYD